MKRLTVSAKIDTLFVKGERKRVVLVKGSKWDGTNNLKAQLNVVSHEMCRKSKSVSRFILAQMILILGSSKGTSFTLKDSHTITMIVYEDSSDLISADNVQARRIENEDPLLTWELSIFQKAVPLITKREVNRVHISDWNMVNLFMMKREESLGLF